MLIKSLTTKCPAPQEDGAWRLGGVAGPVFFPGSGVCPRFDHEVIWPLVEHLENQMQPLAPMGLVLSGVGGRSLTWHCLLAYIPSMLCHRRCFWRSCVWHDAQPVRPHSISSTTCWPVGMALSGEMGQREQGGCSGLPPTDSSWALPLDCIPCRLFISCLPCVRL